MSSRHLSVGLRWALLTVIILVFSAAPALAAMEDAWTPGSITSETNPDALIDRETSWRWGWGNSLYPELTFSDGVPADDQIVTTGFLYLFNLEQRSIPSAELLQPVDFTPNSSGTLFEHTFDVLGIMAGNRHSPRVQPDANLALGEGQWYAHIRLVNPVRAASPESTIDIPMGVDVTAPRPVENLRATIDGSNAVPAGTWTPYTRRILRWNRLASDGRPYDKLSGPGAFELKVNGEVRAKALCPAPSPSVYWWAADRGITPQSATLADPDVITVETLPAGRSTIEITVLDRATNRSESRSVIAQCDPDVPTVTITGPTAAGATLGMNDLVSAVATDGAGVSAVGFYVDGSSVGTETPGALMTEFDAQHVVDWAAYSAGAHTLTVKALDMLGREVTASSSFILDKSRPRPELLIAQPSAFQSMNSRAPIRFAAQDDFGVTSVELEVDGVNVGTYRPTSPITTAFGRLVLADLTAFTPGTHNLVVRVTNTLGNVETQTVPFVYDTSVLLAADMYRPFSDVSGWAGTTETNPSKSDETQSFWRQGWGNSLYPQLTVTSPTVDPLVQPELLYSFGRDPSVTVDVTDPAKYLRSVMVNQTHLTGRVDVASVLAEDPTADGRTLYPLRAQAPAEGWWYMAMDVVNADGTHSGTARIPFGIDVTKPGQVTGLKAYASPTASTVLPAWSPNSRVHLKWDAKEYDSLSGTAYFRVQDGGAPLVPGADATIYDPAAGSQGVPWYKGASSGALTIEDLSAGQHSITVTAVDRATNEGVASAAVKIGVDPDMPTVSWTNPAESSSVVGGRPTFSANASDAAGVAKVEFFIDGVRKHTDTSRPYTFPANLTAFGNGTTHTLKVQATDMVGRVASASRTVRLDKSAPKITSVSAGPTPFYPRKRDGYKDNMIARFKVSERSTVDLLIYTSSGKYWRTVSAGTKSAGSVSVVWNGQSNGGKVASGAFKYKIRATDAYGNTATSGWGSTEIRFYQIVRVSPSAVKVIER